MEIRGPILPHMVHNLCDMMKNASLDKFSLTFADIECTKAFTSVTSAHIGRLDLSQKWVFDKRICFINKSFKFIYSVSHLVS